MCTCDPSNNVTEEYHTAFSDLETSTPEEWRTSTRYEGDITTPQYTPTPTRRPLRRDIQRTIPRMPMRATRRTDLTAGVAIVPRRIDFDAMSDVDDFDGEEDKEEMAKETLERLRSSAQQSYIPEATVAPRTYRIKRTRMPRFPVEHKRQYAPRMVRMTPCGKCLRM